MGGYRDYLQADAFSGYDRLHSRGVAEVGCWAHGRRRFYEARTSDPERAHEALARIRLLYEVERAGKELNDADRLALRRERSAPALERLDAWLREQANRALPKSPIGEAIGYARSNWAAPNRYLEAGYLAIDNNAAERALRPVAMSRKNWLFCGSEGGGRTAAILFSMTASFRGLGIDPFAYLRDAIDRVAWHPVNRVGDLLPERRPRLRDADGPARSP
jgi:hypothetical protein